MGAALDTGNMGVSALASSLVRLVLDARPGAEISFFIANRTAEPQVLETEDRRVSLNIINYRKSPKARPGEHLLTILLLGLLYRVCPSARARILKASSRLRALSEADFVGDIRGGDSFSEIYGFQRFFFGSFPSLMAILLGKRLVLLPQKYGPYKTSAGRAIARFILRRADRIMARDRASIALIHELLGPTAGSKKILFVPDIAFVMDRIEEPGARIEPVLPPETHPLVGININGLVWNGGYTRNNMFGLAMDYREFAHSLTSRLLDDPAVHILLTPHTFALPDHVESDNAACASLQSALREKYPGRVHLLTSEHDCFRMKGIIGRCDFFVGSRMHACIAALSQGIPTAGVAYSDKFRGVFDSVDMAHLVIDARTTSAAVAVDAIVQSFSNRAREALELKTRVAAIQQQVYDAFREMIPRPS